MWDVRKSYWEIHQAALGKKWTPKGTSTLPYLSGCLQGKVSYACTGYLRIRISPLAPEPFVSHCVFLINFSESFIQKTVKCSFLPSFLPSRIWSEKRRQMTKIWNCLYELKVEYVNAPLSLNYWRTKPLDFYFFFRHWFQVSAHIVERKEILKVQGWLMKTSIFCFWPCHELLPIFILLLVNKMNQLPWCLMTEKCFEDHS